jgi:hypothetical protein
MPADDDRRELFDVLEPSLGSRGAALLMAQLPPVGWADLATKSDLGALRSELTGEMAKLGAKVDTMHADLRRELRGDISDLRVELKGDVSKLKADISGLRVELKDDVSSARGELGGLRGELVELRGEVARLVPRLWAANVATMFGVAALVLTIALFFR